MVGDIAIPPEHRLRSTGKAWIVLCNRHEPDQLIDRWIYSKLDDAEDRAEQLCEFFGELPGTFTIQQLDIVEAEHD